MAGDASLGGKTRPGEVHRSRGAEPEDWRPTRRDNGHLAGSWEVLDGNPYSRGVSDEIFLAGGKDEGGSSFALMRTATGSVLVDCLTALPELPW